MKKLLGQIAQGADPNTTAEVSRLLGGREAHARARTLLALYKRGYLQLRRGGGLEISEKGKASNQRRGGGLEISEKGKASNQP